MIIRKSFAKINITLEILRKREDGYHDISSLMQTIDLSDEISFSHSDMTILRSNWRSMETDGNLIMQAAESLSKYSGYTGGADIFLNKNIPLSSGMGGGSSNAACTLLALNSLWGLNIGLTALHRIADGIGSDVSFFLGPGTALVQGKGDIIEPVASLPRLYFLIVTPDIDIDNKTSLLYSNVKADMFTSGEYSQKVVGRINQNRPIRGSDTYNVFDKIYGSLFPEIDWYKKTLLDSGAKWVQFTGSGPSLYTFSEDKDLVVSIMDRLVNSGVKCAISSTISPDITDFI